MSRREASRQWALAVVAQPVPHLFLLLAATAIPFLTPITLSRGGHVLQAGPLSSVHPYPKPRDWQVNHLMRFSADMSLGHLEGTTFPCGGYAKRT